VAATWRGLDRRALGGAPAPVVGFRFELWVGAAVLANNLMRIAAMLMTRSSRRRKAA